MRRLEVEIEHFYNKRFVERKRLLPTDKMTIIGKTKDCSIKLMGEGVSNIHASIDFKNNIWTVSDLASEQGTWVKKQPIVSYEVKAPTIVRIGNHELKINPKLVVSNLFAELPIDAPDKVSKLDIKSGNDEKRFHQVILKKNSFVIGAKLLPENEDFTFTQGNQSHILKAPKDSKWKFAKHGDIIIQHRIVSSKVLEEKNMDKVTSLWDPNMKGPISVATGILSILLIIFFLFPSDPNAEMDQLKPEPDNKFTRMIFDAKAIKQKREEARKISKAMNKNSPNVTAPQKSETLNVAKTEPSAKAKVINQIKAAGLSQLIGRISMRAANNAKYIPTQGVTPDSGVPARGVSSVVGVADNLNSKANSTYKVAAVGTLGKAGGSSSYKNMGGLALGNVGSASVGVLDEETEIDGGLDKDEIARVIEKNLGQIRYCYERQLSASPDLYGKVMVKFTIGGNGAVEAQNIGLTTLKSAMVEGCILRRVSGWMFPKPKGGTQVRVTYPFLFKSTN